MWALLGILTLLSAVTLMASELPARNASNPSSGHGTGESASGRMVCHGQPAPRVSHTRPDHALNRRFARYGNSDHGWSGGDSTYSTLLPSGRLLWLFSDTFLGTVNPDGSRTASTPQVHNSLVLQRGGRFVTIRGGSSTHPRAVLTPRESDSWYWVGASMVSHGTLSVIYRRYERTGSGEWDWTWRDNVLARYALPKLDLIDTHPLPSTGGIQWGSWLTRHGGHTYIYGVGTHAGTKYMHVARVRGDDLRHPWAYSTGKGWSRAEDASEEVAANVAGEYSVTRFHGLFMLVTHDTRTRFNDTIVAYFSCRPTGPFTARTRLYTTPETGSGGTYHNADVYTYNAHTHPALRDGNRLLISYNVNSLDADDVRSDASIYRPRFVEVTLMPARSH